MSERSVSSPRGLRADSAGLDSAFDALTDEVRCVAIEHLAVVDESVSLDSLAGVVVSATTGISDRRRMKIRLHHVHLPKLVAAGLAEYDPDERSIEPTPKTETALELLQGVDDHS